jgi:nitrate/nitrite-specific signal transduction histidine kinase
LRVMQYRAGVIGGSLVVQRRPDGGTTFACTIKDANAEPG